MAEIPVEKKSSSKWLWILLLAIVAALLLWWLLADNDGDADNLDGDTVAVEESIDTADEPVATAGAMTIAAITANPAEYYGKEGFEGTVAAAGPLTDRGFWIENDGARMFAIVIDAPAERRIDINPGQTLMLNGGTIREASTISAEGIEGDALDEDTMNVIADQDAVLVIDESNITIEEDA
ncbi:hypothetical protein [Alteriqipengyuania sp. 357]